MQLDKMSVNIRPLPAYEAMDLGFGVARAWYGELIGLWLGTALKFWLPVAVLFVVGRVFLDWKMNGLVSYFPFVFWWLKPVFERPLLVFLSQKLFNDHFQAKDTTAFAKSLPTYRSSLISMLTRHRLSSRRHTAFSVRLLEGQSNAKAVAQRIRVLSRREGGVHLMHTIVMYHVEVLLAFGTMALLAFSLSSSIGGDLNGGWFNWITNFPSWVTVLFWLIGLVAMAVVAPFFVASGFVMYLCKRSLLEAWDVELIFRQLAHRHQSTQKDLHRNLHHSTQKHSQGGIR